MWFDGSHHGWMLGPFGFGMIAFWILLGVLFVFLWKVLRNRDPERSTGASRPTAREILDERYARGEINRDEYEQKKRDITG